MPKKTDNLTVRCPCCEAVLTVHSYNWGSPLYGEAEEEGCVVRGRRSNSSRQDKDTADDRFRDAFEKEESRMKTVEDKFQEALKRKDELEEPIRPLDWD